MCFYFLILVLVLIKDVYLSQDDLTTIKVALSKNFILNCENKTQGTFETLVWTTDANAATKYSVYSIGVHDGEVISSNYKGRLKRIKGTSLEIFRAKSTDNGIYECNILHKVKKVEKLMLKVAARYKVDVIHPPIIISVSPKQASIKLHTASKIFCKAQSLSPFNLSWKFSNHKYKLYNHDYNITKHDSYHNDYYTTTLTLNILNMTRRLDSRVTCIAKNIGGRVFKKIRAKMLVPPVVTTPRKIQAFINKDAIIHCNVTSYPKSKITWDFLKKFDPIKLSEKEKIEKYSVSPTLHYYMAKQYHSSSSLRIRNIQRNELGIYICTADNTVGYDQKEFEVIGYSVPDQPQILYAKGEMEQITLYWNYIYNGGKPINSVTIKYKRDADFEWSRITISKLNFEITKKYTVPNLKPASVYTFRISLENDIGEGIFSSEYNAETTTKENVIQKRKRKTMTIGPLNILTFLCILGAILLVSTCIIGGLCIYFQGRRIKQRKVQQRERRCKMKDIEMTTERLVNHYSMHS